MNILEIYKKYNIMPQLAEHQLRVAGVASLICNNFNSDINRDDIIAACLLHDMGNIVKFDFSVFPEVVADKGLEYWEKIKQETIEKYGSTTHTVTNKIVSELSVGPQVLELVDAVGFDQAIKNMNSQNMGKKICAYSDMRVGPFGIISLEERIQDLKERYGKKPLAKTPEQRAQFENALREIEKQIFSKCSILPADITNTTVTLEIEKLKNISI